MDDKTKKKYVNKSYWDNILSFLLKYHKKTIETLPNYEKLKNINTD